jgi:3-deoxy-D-manno-octulosonic-acid transferase
MLILYSLALFLLLVVGSPWWLWRMATSGKYRQGLSERLGFVPARIRAGIRSEPTLWIHAVSVGEVVAAGRLIDGLTERLPDYRVLVSTTTRTGQTLARERFGADHVFYFPLDFAFAVRSWLSVLRPRMLVLLETEFWPRVLTECRHGEIPVAVVNARISDRSWPRYRRLAFLWKRLLGGVSVALAQSELDAERLRALGPKNIQVAGNLKFDIRAAKPAAVTAALREHLPPGVPVLVCGSTLAGEEEMVLDAIPPGIVTILAPRHPERFSDVAQILSRRGVRALHRSAWMQARAAIPAGAVFLLDSIGELASLYSLATAAFVGGSLVPMGGHNPLEPAQFGVPIVIGPSFANFRGIVDLLRRHNAIRIAGPAELRATLAELLTAGPEAQAMGARAREVFAAEAGATERTVHALLALLEAHP